MQELCLYVAVDGCDRWSGRLSKPNATGNDGPLATLTRARDAASLIKRTHRGPIKILILAGTHYLAEPLVLGPEDSGSADGTITYAAMPAEQATLSGGRRLEVSWQPYRDGIMMGSPQGQGPLDFSQLFVNGRRQIRARYPNYDSANPLVGGGGWVTAAPRGNLPGLPVHYELGSRSWIREVEAAFVPHTEFDFDPATFTKKRWSRPDEAVVHAMTSHPHLTSCGWGSIHYQVKDVDWTNHRIRLGKGGWQMSEVCTGPPTINESSRFYVENVFEELDAPGEWYFDRRQQVLYYYPPKGLDLSAARVETDGIKHLVELRGRKDRPVHHVRLEGLRLAHSAVTYLDPYETPSLGDWSIYRGGAIVLEGTEDCEVRNCFFDALGGNGVFLNCYNRRADVCGNKFVELGDSAVCLVGRSHLRSDLNYTCPFCGQEHCWNWDTP
ncbi:MAG: hypothetical protein HQ546_06920, partial [Planctomycetes bacterium]|nr:hypothetical protein [Planctomycetota bacterium]